MRAAVFHISFTVCPAQTHGRPLYYRHTLIETHRAVPNVMMPTQAVFSLTVLVVESDAQQRQALLQALQSSSYTLLEADNARETLRLARQHRPYVIVLPDRALPDMHGHALCAKLRTLPFVERSAILFVGNRPNAEAVAHALDCGGDDYLRTPFDPLELQARVRALSRRARSWRASTAVTLHLDPNTHSVRVGERHVYLTPTEFALLSHLCGQPRQPHSAASLLRALWWHVPAHSSTALVRNHIRNLRRKIEENPAQPRIIVSLHGRGYAIRAQTICWH